VWINKKHGGASTNELNDAALRAVVEEAERLARISPVDREYLPTLGAQTYKPTGGYAEAVANIPVAERARQINEVITACEKAGVIGAGFHQASANATASATKNGNFNYERTSLVSLGVTTRTPDGSSSGFFLRSHFDAKQLDTARIAREAIRKAIESRNARTIEPGIYPVILEPQAVADLLGSATFNLFNARTADEGRSAFSASGGKTRLGEKVFDERINIYSDPWNAELPGSQASQEGLPAQKIHLVGNGVLENLIYSRFWAQQKGKQPTPGPVNLILESSSSPATVEEMIKATPRGLLVSRFWYIRPTDPRTTSLTGLTRDGVWYIENGKIQYPVRNFRFNQSIIQMLAPGNIEMISAPERIGSSENQGRNALLLPALKLKAFNFTSQSEAV
ncbi:MAG TPA: TldD/PmbA family protein, partial [Blastocatellia bacterium]|nr:TldD/PmbA family protein [Blastocatellia bacterium]